MFFKNINHQGSIFYGAYRPQLLATLTVSLMSYSYGIAVGWVTPMLLKMQTSDSPLNFTITVVEASWVGSLWSIGGMFGTLFYGSTLTRFGGKICLYLLAMPQLIFWILVFFTSEVLHLYIARLIGGITGGGIFVIAPIFVSEIADAPIRGALGSMFSFSLNFGMLSGFIIASYVPYIVIPCVITVLPVIFIFLATRFPESSRFLLRKGKTEAAEISFQFYHNFNSKNKDDASKISSDFNELQLSMDSNNSKNPLKMRDFYEKQSLWAIGVGFVVVFVNKFSGLFAILNYASMIFADTGSIVDPNTSTIIIGVVQTVGAYVAITLIDKYGRKILLLVSTSGMCLGLTLLGAYSYLAHETDADLTNWMWLPLVLMSLIIFSANVGVVTVTFVLIVEILPSKIRSQGSVFFIFLGTGMAFVCLKVMPVLMTSIGLSGVMWIFAGVCAFGFIFDLTVLEETKGKSIDN